MLLDSMQSNLYQAISDGGDEERGGGDPLLTVDADPVAALRLRPPHHDVTRVVDALHSGFG